LVVGSLDYEQEMYQKFPKLAALTRALMEQDFGKTQSAFVAFMSSSPEERYRKLLTDRPDLLGRAPQHQIASYLGVTPESLSRIRKRIFVKK
jgi:CRP-like cAMP-binding protein